MHFENLKYLQSKKDAAMETDRRCQIDNIQDRDEGVIVLFVFKC